MHYLPDNGLQKPAKTDYLFKCIMTSNIYRSNLITVRNKINNNLPESLLRNNDSGKLLVKHEKIIADPYLHLQEFPEIKEYLSNIFNDIAIISDQFSVELDDITEHNINKVHSRYDIEANKEYTLFDSKFPEHEQIPRVMDVEIESDNKGRSITWINGAKFGDPLRDNNYEDDGYRFHDIFHIAHAAVLGWSPTLRALLRRKRKSNPDIDDVEDGGRAIVTEEGITAMIFGHAKTHNFFHNHSIDLDLIRVVRNTVSHLEVKERNEHDWQKAIFAGYDAWRYIKNRGNGSIIADLNARTIKLI